MTTDSIELPLLPSPPINDFRGMLDGQHSIQYSAAQMREYALLAIQQEREAADAFRWLMANIETRVALATEVFGYEKMDVPSREWLEDQIAEAIRKG